MTTAPQSPATPDTSILSNLPDELIDGIFDFLPSTSLARVSGVSKSLANLANNSPVWRRHCRIEWRYWHPRHDIRDKLLAATTQTDWKSLWTLRKQTDRSAATHFEHVLARQTDRIPHIEVILKYGYDAKDYLLSQILCPDDAEDVLARRYWASEILGSVERAVAMDTWEGLPDNGDVLLERVLGAIDLWVAQQPAYDLDDISARLDAIAASFMLSVQNDMQGFEEWTARQKAVRLGSHLHQLRLLSPPSSESRYRSLRNILIGVVLADSDHDGLQLVGAAIYCCIARRIGLDARLTNFPTHVYIVIPAGNGIDQHGRPIKDPTEPIYIEPWGGHEISLRTLESQLVSMGQPAERFAAYLRPAETIDMVVRMGNNLLASVQSLGLNFETVLGRPSLDLIPTRGESDTGPPDRYQIAEPVVLNPFRAAYCACWLRMVMRSTESIRSMQGDRASILLMNGLVQQLEAHQHDISLVETYILPKFSPSSSEYNHLKYTVSKRIRDDDADPKTVKRRPSPTTGVRGSANNYADTVQYRVGDMFRHKRYNYTAVVIGWDPACMASQSWIDHMGIDSLPGGRGQSFYNVFVEDQSTRYVAEENIGKIGGDVEPRAEMPGPGLMREAGKWFKRFDAREQRFVSNLQDEYPDD